MCSLPEHSARPEYRAEDDQVWQKVDGQWVDVTPGVDLGLMDSSPDVESHG